MISLMGWEPCLYLYIDTSYMQACNYLHCNIKGSFIRGLGVGAKGSTPYAHPYTQHGHWFDNTMTTKPRRIKYGVDTMIAAIADVFFTRFCRACYRQ